MTKKTKKTKTERLLDAIRERDGMTRQEITQFLLGGKRKSRKVISAMALWNYSRTETRVLNDYWNAQLFGTSHKLGLVGRFLKLGADGKFRVTRLRKGPFYPKKVPQVTRSPQVTVPSLSERFQF